VLVEDVHFELEVHTDYGQVVLNYSFVLFQIEEDLLNMEHFAHEQVVPIHVIGAVQNRPERELRSLGPKEEKQGLL
jgi:hypothetical protein